MTMTTIKDGDDNDDDDDNDICFILDQHDELNFYTVTKCLV